MCTGVEHAALPLRSAAIIARSTRYGERGSGRPGTARTCDLDVISILLLPLSYGSMVAADQGLEPRFRDPESRRLPLAESAIGSGRRTRTLISCPKNSSPTVERFPSSLVAGLRSRIAVSSGYEPDVETVSPVRSPHSSPRSPSAASPERAPRGSSRSPRQRSARATSGRQHGRLLVYWRGEKPHLWVVRR